MAFHLTFVCNCKQALQNSPVFPRQLSIASVPAGEHQHCHTRAASPRSGAVVRDFKKRAFPMAEERWSVAHGQGNGKGKMVNGKGKNESK
jgi:hypothetical protein